MRRRVLRACVFLWVMAAGMQQMFPLEFAVDGIGYVTNADDPSTVYIAGRVGTGIAQVLKFPKEVEFEGVSYPITHMKAGVFSNSIPVRDVDMSELEIDVIPDRAFEGCVNLTSVEMPTAVVVRIGDSAFSGCTSLKSVTIPSTVMYVGESSFEGCPLSSLVISGAAGVMTVGNKAFYCEGQVTDVVTYRETPPVFSSDDAQGFSEESYRMGRLDIRVSGGQARYSAVKSAYQSADVWRNFYIDNPTAVSAPDGDGYATVRVDGDGIVAPAGSRIYSLCGAVVNRTLLAPGIYIVVSPGNEAVRVVIR